MYRVGQKEIGALAETITTKRLFRYSVGNECSTFEERYGKYLGSKYVQLTSSGTTALTAAMVGLGIGPGDEVLVPACTYIATAIAVLAAGAIPVVVDIDESITLSPAAVEAAIGPHTRAIVPVHMWGLPADMDALMAVARRHNLLVLEDACQAVGGGYKGRKLASIGDAGAFSFNYYKNMTCGEGGAFVTNSEDVFNRGGCMVDCCRFYWADRENTDKLFVASGARASELEGAMLNCQLNRIDEMVLAMRERKKRILAGVEGSGLVSIRNNSLEDECGTHAGLMLPTVQAAEDFVKICPCTIAGKTGRHVYTEWDPLFAKRGAHHPALNPYNLKENQDCRLDLTKDQCAKSLDILNRTLLVGTNPDTPLPEVDRTIERLCNTAKQILG